MKDSDIGRMKALLDMHENSVSELKEVELGLSDVSNRLKHNAVEIDSLRDIVGEVQDIVKKHTRPEWLTTTELADELGMNPNTIRRLHKAGKIPGYKLTEHSHLRFDRQEVSKRIKGDVE